MDNCIFCMIMNGQIPSRKIYEDYDCIVMLDINPMSKGHALVLPKTHSANLLTIEDALAGKLLCVAKKIGQMSIDKLGATGFNIMQNNGESAGQTVQHFHIHVIPRYEGEKLSFEPKEVSGEALDEVLAQYHK